jgi:hypothetical protein
MSGSSTGNDPGERGLAIGGFDFGRQNDGVLIPAALRTDAMGLYKGAAVFAGSQIGLADLMVGAPGAGFLAGCFSLGNCHDLAFEILRPEKERERRESGGGPWGQGKYLLS